MTEILSNSLHIFSFSLSCQLMFLPAFGADQRRIYLLLCGYSDSSDAIYTLLYWLNNNLILRHKTVREKITRGMRSAFQRSLRNDFWATENLSSFHTLRCVFPLSSCCRRLQPPPHCPHSTLTNRHTKITDTHLTALSQEHQQTLRRLQIEDIAKMNTKPRGWKLRLDITSSQGLNSELNASASMSVCTFLFVAKMTSL